MAGAAWPTPAEHLIVHEIDESDDAEATGPRNDITDDHPGRRFERDRLCLAGSFIASSSMVWTAAGAVLLSEPSTCTSMELELGCDVGSTPKTVKP